MTAEETKPTTTSKSIKISEPTVTGPVPLTFTVEPTSGSEQTPLVISGTDFGDVAGRILLNEVPAPALTWTNSTINTIVPYGATSGDLMVITVEGRRGSVAFTVEKKTE